jgi:hypothetical protein
MRVVRAAWVVLVLGAGTVTAAELPDLGGLPAKPGKEPAYMAKQPLYGRAVFGPKGDKLVWMVLDKSRADGEAYDVLYLNFRRFW